jgi:hypothetical protein
MVKAKAEMDCSSDDEVCLNETAATKSKLNIQATSFVLEGSTRNNEDARIEVGYGTTYLHGFVIIRKTF